MKRVNTDVITSVSLVSCLYRCNTVSHPIFSKEEQKYDVETKIEIFYR